MQIKTTMLTKYQKINVLSGQKKLKTKIRGVRKIRHLAPKKINSPQSDLVNKMSGIEQTKMCCPGCYGFSGVC